MRRKLRAKYVEKMEMLTVPEEHSEVILRRVRPLLGYLDWANGDVIRLLACAYIQGLMDGDQARQMLDEPLDFPAAEPKGGRKT